MILKPEDYSFRIFQNISVYLIIFQIFNKHLEKKWKVCKKNMQRG